MNLAACGWRHESKTCAAAVGSAARKDSVCHEAAGKYASNGRFGPAAKRRLATRRRIPHNGTASCVLAASLIPWPGAVAVVTHLAHGLLCFAMARAPLPPMARKLGLSLYPLILINGVASRGEASPVQAPLFAYEILATTLMGIRIVGGLGVDVRDVL